MIFQRGLSLHGLSRGSDAGEVADDLLGVLGLAGARFAAEKLIILHYSFLVALTLLEREDSTLTLLT